MFNPIALRKAKIVYNFVFLSAIGLSQFLHTNDIGEIPISEITEIKIKQDFDLSGLILTSQ